MEDFLLFFLAGMFGGDFAKKILEGDDNIKIPYISIYCVCFTTIYIIFLLIAISHSLKGNSIDFKTPCIVAFSLGTLYFIIIILGLKFKKHLK
ncbi:hypothetical protein [Acinetobacter junii]|uniref:hypothetical protein n=1 Tax=Acinetobacter junii TaxID=40215 RepID=UPI002447478C|nr:hypothetical protein [Acinetobacter junii]MDH0719819.1 hypothetical protein [Acinetobacter junii]